LCAAAYDLQARIGSFIEAGWVVRALHDGTADEKQHVIDYTVFLFAQYCAWIELIRQRILFIDLSKDEASRELNNMLKDVGTALKKNNAYKPFRLFEGEMRAIGEVMIDGDGCVGFNTFLDKIYPSDDVATNINQFTSKLIQSLKGDVAKIPSNRTDVSCLKRLETLQIALLAVAQHLDKNGVRYGKEKKDGGIWNRLHSNYFEKGQTCDSPV
jgi:hypothetical protein